MDSKHVQKPFQGPPQIPLPPSDGAPSKPGFALIWSDDFSGPAGAAVNPDNWETYTGPVYNNEVETYTNSTANAQLSGTGQLNIIPLNVPGPMTWTSGRLHGKHSFSCDPGHMMILEAQIRVGANPPENQQGIWPAFWALGADFNNPSVGWPKCGEWDILELRNGSNMNNGTIHFGENQASHQMIHQGDPGTPFEVGAYH